MVFIFGDLNPAATLQILRKQRRVTGRPGRRCYGKR